MAKKNKNIATMERALATLTVINRNEHASIADMNLVMYLCIYCNKL